MPKNVVAAGARPRTPLQAYAPTPIPGYVYAPNATKTPLTKPLGFLEYYHAVSVLVPDSYKYKLIMNATALQRAGVDSRQLYHVSLVANISARAKIHAP